MQTYAGIETLRKDLDEARRGGRRIGLVPTMGGLHSGHAALMRLARAHGDVLVVSLFVNPIQFDHSDDLAAYPRQPQADLALCEAEGVDGVFMPVPDVMYAPDHSVAIAESRLSKRLCGANRPGHFSGVCTVVCKLFNIVRPHLAVFGEKDFQQLQIVRRLVRDLNIPVELLAAPTVREEDGLAMSTRNRRLNAAARRQAVCLYRALTAAREALREGCVEVGALRRVMKGMVTAQSLADLEYADIVDPETLEPLPTVSGPARAMLAATIDGVRLIDNAALESG